MDGWVRDGRRGEREGKNAFKSLIRTGMHTVIAFHLICSEGPDDTHTRTPQSEPIPWTSSLPAALNTGFIPSLC